MISTQFTSEKHADNIHILGFCNGNALALLKECRLQFSNITTWGAWYSAVCINFWKTLIGVTNNFSVPT